MSAPSEVPAARGHRAPTPSASPDDDWAVHTTDLTKTYSTGRSSTPVQALGGLSLAIRPGELFGLLGPNGAGKSTTVKVLATLTRADSGAASVAGHDVARSPDAVRRSIGLVPQKSSAAPLMTGRESIELAARMFGQTHRQARDRTTALLRRFDLTDAADRLARTYSGGTARRLDVAIGLVNQPTVLFLDEPTTGLDPEARADLWAEIARMAQEEEMTVLLTTHYLEEADHLADRLAIIDHGRVVVEGTPDELKSELRGDGVVVEIADADHGSAALDLLAAMPDLSQVTQCGRELRARADAGARAILPVLSAFESARIPVASASVTRPSLDDVYLRHVGRMFQEATR